MWSTKKVSISDRRAFGCVQLKIVDLQDGQILHVETPNAVVNIRCGLRALEGNYVDSVEILPDVGCTRDGPANVRVIREGETKGS
jgi:hypothetical protein